MPLFTQPDYAQQPDQWGNLPGSPAYGQGPADMFAGVGGGQPGEPPFYPGYQPPTDGRMYPSVMVQGPDGQQVPAGWTYTGNVGPPPGGPATQPQPPQNPAPNLGAQGGDTYYVGGVPYSKTTGWPVGQQPGSTRVDATGTTQYNATGGGSTWTADPTWAATWGGQLPSRGGTTNPYTGQYYPLDLYPHGGPGSYVKPDGTVGYYAPGTSGTTPTPEGNAAMTRALAAGLGRPGGTGQPRPNPQPAFSAATGGGAGATSQPGRGYLGPPVSSGRPQPNQQPNPQPSFSGYAGMTRGQQNSSFLNQTRGGLPAPNQIVARNWLQLPQSTRDLALSAYEKQGWNPQDVEHTIGKLLPGRAGAGGVGVQPGTWGRIQG